ncbi:MAG: flagellar P-ring protein precursor FlgI [Candidatus Paceibacteria bacterium]|jgi:flagellar P-ring protein precursor FlgI
MLNLLLSVALFAGPILPQDTTGSPDIGDSSPGESSDGVTPNLWLGSGSGLQAPTQPRYRSTSTVSRTRRFAPVAAQTGITATRTPISSLVSVRGMEDNHVMGIGLVTGLAGTGDSGDAAKQLLQNLLLTRNINISTQALSSENIAIVRVEGIVPAGIRAGQPIDVRASTIGNADSLQGGTLAMTELTDVTGRFVFATASGPVTVGGFSVGGDSATATKNHVTVGTLPGGGKVEREVKTSLVSEHGFLFLDIRAAHDTLGNVVNVTEAINEMYPGVAQPSSDGKSVRVRVPADLPTPQHAAFAHSILRREVISENVARVIINERSGIIVMGGDVRLQPGIITHGNLTVTVAETPETSQPGPLSNGSTQNLDRTELNVEEEDAALTLTPGAGTLQEVVDVLNVLGTTPRDMITILQAMSQSGMLLAEIRRM